MPMEPCVEFADIEWIVLDRKEDRVLLLTKEMVEQRDFHGRKEGVTWEDSAMRRYLNEVFLAKFPGPDRDRVLATTVENRENPWYKTPGGNPTVDRLFLLSLDEVVRFYFGDSSRLLDFPKEGQRYWFDRKDPNNQRRQAVYRGSSWWWWLRTPGKNNRVFSYIHGDGNIGIQGNGIAKTTFNTLHPETGSNCGGVRPAMWVRWS